MVTVVSSKVKPPKVHGLQAAQDIERGENPDGSAAKRTKTVKQDPESLSTTAPISGQNGADFVYVEENQLKQYEIEKQNVLQQEYASVHHERSEGKYKPRRAEQEDASIAQLGTQSGQAEEMKHAVREVRKAERDVPIELHWIQSVRPENRLDIVWIRPANAPASQLAKSRGKIQESQRSPARVTPPGIFSR